MHPTWNWLWAFATLLVFLKTAQKVSGGRKDHIRCVLLDVLLSTIGFMVPLYGALYDGYGQKGTTSRLWMSGMIWLQLMHLAQ